jgi:hypothetical protein
MIDRLRRLLPGLWVGILVGVGGLATPALFAGLPVVDAGRIAGQIFAREAPASLALGAALLLLERRRSAASAVAAGGSQFSAELGLVLGALFCTVFGYYALVPQMAAARAGQGVLSFAALHIISSTLFAAKAVLVLVLAWRATRGAAA